MKLSWENRNLSATKYMHKSFQSFELNMKRFFTSKQVLGQNLILCNIKTYYLFSIINWPKWSWFWCTSWLALFNEKKSFGPFRRFTFRTTERTYNVILEKQTFKQCQFNLLAKNRFKRSSKKLSNTNSAFQPQGYLLEWLLSLSPFSLSLFYSLYTTRMPPKLLASSSSDIVGIYSRLAKVLSHFTL